MKKKKIYIIFAGIAMLLVITLVGFHFYQQQKTNISTDDAAIDGEAIVLRPKVQGYVKNIYVEDNGFVKAGDVICEIDPIDYQLKVNAAEAKLAMAQAALAAGQSEASKERTAAPARSDAAQKKIGSVQANWKKMVDDKNRMESLFANGACSQQEYEHAVAAESAAKATLDSTVAEASSVDVANDSIAVAENTVVKLEADVKQAIAELEQAKQDLMNTKIIAPSDGRFTKRGIEVGS